MNTHRSSLLALAILALTGCDSGAGGAQQPGPDTRSPEDQRGDVSRVDAADAAAPFACRAPTPARIVDDLRDETFDLGPYLMVPTDTGITIMWRTLEEEDGAVLYGLGDDTDQEILQVGASTVHSVRLEGLSLDTRYGYRVRSGDRTSDLHHFYTAPPFGGSFRFAAWGDNQGGEPFPEVVAGILDDAPHIILGLGDHVSNGQNDWEWKDIYLDLARPLFHEVAIFAAFGNHGKNGPMYYELMGYEDIAVAPDQESVYSFTYGNAFFLVFDTNGIFFPIGEVESPWSAFIKEQVASEAAQQATWRIAYAHEPGAPPEISNSPDCGGVYLLTVTNFMIPLLQEHGFHAYLSGHSHLWERTMFGDLLHIISGGGGGGLELCEDPPDLEKAITFPRHHFTRGVVGCDSFRVEAVGLDGEVFDWVELGPEPGTILDEMNHEEGS